jgi:hypothetical protein
VIAYLSLTVALPLLHLWRWVPLATSVYSVIHMLFPSMQLFTLRRQAEAVHLDRSPAS